MHQISIIGTPTIQGFDLSPINGKISGANLTITMAITKNGTVFQPQDPVRIRAWLNPTPQEQPKSLSPASGNKDDLLWTKTAADQGSITIVFRITMASLDRASLARRFLAVTPLRIRADLPRSKSEETLTTSIPLSPTDSIAGLHSSVSLRPEGEGVGSSILERLLDIASVQTPLDMITIGIDTLRVALHIAPRLSMKMWKAALSHRVSPALFRPSTIVIADDADEIITAGEGETTTEEWARHCIKAEYIDHMIETGKTLKYAVRMMFQNLDSLGLSNGACDRAWSLVIVADDISVIESTRVSRAKQIEAVTTSSIWHSTDRAPPKLLLIMRGPFPGEQLTLLNLVQYDGWEVVEQFSQLPKEVFPEAKDSDEKYFLLEYQLRRRDYTEIVVLKFEGQISTRARQSKIDPEPRLVVNGTADGTVTVEEGPPSHLAGPQATSLATREPAAPHFHSKRSPSFLDSIPQGAGEVKNETSESQAQPTPAAKRGSSPVEPSRYERKRMNTDNPLEEANGSILDTECDDTAAEGPNAFVLPSATDTNRALLGQLDFPRSWCKESSFRD